MEGFWGILKGERYYGKRFYSKKALVDMIENFIRYYNTRRVQRKLGVLTPIRPTFAPAFCSRMLLIR